MDKHLDTGIQFMLPGFSSLNGLFRNKYIIEPHSTDQDIFWKFSLNAI